MEGRQELYDPNHRLNRILKRKHISKMPPEANIFGESDIPSKLLPPFKLYLDHRLPKSFREFYGMYDSAGGKQKEYVEKVRKALIKRSILESDINVIFDSIKTSLGFLLMPNIVFGKTLPKYQGLNDEHRVSELLASVHDEFRKEWIFKVLKRRNFIPNQIMAVYEKAIEYLLKRSSISLERKERVISELAVCTALEVAVRSVEKNKTERAMFNPVNVLTAAGIKQSQIPVTKEILNFSNVLVKCIESQLRCTKKEMGDLEKLTKEYPDIFH